MKITKEFQSELDLEANLPAPTALDCRLIVEDYRCTPQYPAQVSGSLKNPTVLPTPVRPMNSNSRTLAWDPRMAELNALIAKNNTCRNSLLTAEVSELQIERAARRKRDDAKNGHWREKRHR